MSIYCTFGVFDDYPDDYPQPFVYRGSHLLPGPGDERGGSLDLAYIPGHITAAGRDDGPDDEEGVWPWLRLFMRPDQRRAAEIGQPEDTIVLDRDQVAALRDELDDWLLRCDDLAAWLEKHR